ncbi:hypothetical protein BGX38DRAFT_1093847 [Terfezia claveryi]|nr:hypothetical protein BGX38DRAFT_1093847 [Terfezia claveryi]
MLDLLTQKLGGLLNRRIYQAPISRQKLGVLLNREIAASRQAVNPAEVTSPKISILSRIRDIFSECQNNGGILLAQPEHLLSFKLTIAEWLCAEKDPQLLNELLKAQLWLGDYARDIFDESDEMLHPRYELIYTTGNKQPLELGAQRWGMIQAIFDLVKSHVPRFKKEYPSAIDLIERQGAPGGFPFVRLIEKDAELKLMSEIAVKIITENLEIWYPTTHPPVERIINYVIDKNAKEDTLSDFDKVPPLILLLKGLIGHEIIAFVLREKRWRVDYGLHKTSKLAVPYRAKDSPVIGAQFAHPDVTIALTCLCYYYTGLTESQLQSCFRHLKNVIDPEGEYHSWIKEYGKHLLPPPLWHLDGANLALEDTHQWSHTLYPIFKLSKKAIDFYLSVEVFPSESQGFASKLSTSAWDLAEKRSQPTTGFSGSSDNRYLLPLSIKQLKLDSHIFTDAKVLSMLLQPENSFYQCLQTKDGERLSGQDLIHNIVQRACSMRQIQVLVDVGAQVLDMENQDAAQYWLSEAAKQDSKWTAALFFNSDAELTVIDKQGGVQSYRSSPYAVTEDMTGCLVYLDEAHTMGTDIKLPENSVAVVTLGPKITKDKLVQACMRMRNLGYGQSVRFVAPPEVNRRILDYSPKSRDRNIHNKIETKDILLWVMHETCIQTEQYLALWASHGIAYQTRHSAKEATESKSLMEMYSSSNEGKSNSLLRKIELKLNEYQLRSQKQELRGIKARCEDYRISSFRNTSLEELQEREVARSQEHQRKDPRPPLKEISTKPCAHELHPSLVQFIETSVRPLPPNTPGSPFRTLVQTLEQTSFSNQIGKDPWTSRILTTVDFSRSLVLKSGAPISEPPAGPETDFPLQPVTWVMSTRALHDSNHLILIIISPFEANELLPSIRRSTSVNLHMYSPRMQNTTVGIFDLVPGSTPPFSNKHYCHNIHPEMEQLMIQVNLYAGELFFSSYEMYRKTCAFLGICDMSKEQPTPSSMECQRPPADIRAGKLDIAHSGDEDTRVSGNKGEMVTTHSAQSKTNRWGFLKDLVKLRARGVLTKHSHMGSLLRGKILQEEEYNREGMVIPDDVESSYAEASLFTE